MSNQERATFRQNCLERDNGLCIVPWCDSEADDVHHILERSLWENGGYLQKNGASLCNLHHQYAETNDIPPQAFYFWLRLTTDDILRPSQIETTDVDKWGDTFDTPPWDSLRDEIKYQSTRHLLPLYWYDSETVAKTRIEHDDTGLQTLEDFVGVPLVITHKMDGGNCMLVNDMDNPVRARNGSSPKETMKKLYESGGLYWQQKVHQKLPDRLQVFGEWMYAKHSIHYGCDCPEPCDDVGPSLQHVTDVTDNRAYFQVFGVYDTTLNLWLSWPEVEDIASTLGFPTTPVIYEESHIDTPTFETTHEAREELVTMARDVIDNGGEGIVVRSKFPYHYGQFGHSVGKYVRENHINTDEHWSHRRTIVNQI